MAQLVMAGDYKPEQVELLKRTICRGSNDDELAMFLMVCNRTGLDPFSKQIHAVKRWNAKTQREEMSIQTGIDGFRLIAERTGKYAGNDDPVYDSEDGQHPQKATVTVWKIVSGQRVPFTKSARWSEFVQTKKDGTPTQFWQRMPYLMLGKVAEALALRTAFPQELSGLYTTEEMGQADNGTEDAEYVTTPRPNPTSRQSQPVAALPIGKEPESANPAESLIKQLMTVGTAEEKATLMDAIKAQAAMGAIGDDDLKRLRATGFLADIRLAATEDDVAAVVATVDKTVNAGRLSAEQAEKLKGAANKRVGAIRDAAGA